MRLTSKQKNIIEKTAIRHFGKKVKVYLFGSRADMKQRGGDIDLLLEEVPQELTTVKKKISFLVDLKKELGDQKIDVFIKTAKNSETLFYQVAGKNKILIC